GDVERGVVALIERRLHEMPEVGQGAELRVHGFVATFLRPDRPGTARFAGFGGLVVGALAVAAADGVDGGKVEDVEPHLGDFRKEPLDIFERTYGPGKELVPGAEPRLDRLHDNLDLTPIGRGEAPVRIAEHQLFHLPARRGGLPFPARRGRWPGRESGPVGWGRSRRTGG